MSSSNAVDMDNSDSADLTQLSLAERRKILKPQVERRRRDRINKSLDDLKEILIQNDSKLRSRASKLEKADILELAVEQMNGHRYSGQSTSSLNGSYTDGYLDCLNGTLMFLWQTGVITSSQTGDVVRDTLLRQLLQKTGQNSTTILSHGMATPSIVHMQPVPFVSDHGTYEISKVPSIAFGTPGFSQMPHVSGLDIFDVSQTPTIPFDKGPQITDINGLGTSGLSTVPFENEVPIPCTGSQLPTASFNMSHSLPKSRYVPYKTKTRPALRNKNADSSGPREELSTRTETIKSDTAAWSLNDDISYSIASFSWKSSDKSDQSLAKESSSNSHEVKKLQEKPRSESIAMSGNSANETQRPLSTKVSSNVQLPGSSVVNATSKSTLRGLRCVGKTQTPLVAESSTVVKQPPTKDD